MTRDVIKLCYHVVDRGLTKLCYHATGPFRRVCFLAKFCHTKKNNVTSQFCHSAICGVTIQFDHVTGYDMIKGVRTKNKVRKTLSLKYF